MFGVTLVLLALSALLSALAWDLSSLAFFRFLNGMGIGAQISLCATLINELSPERCQARNVQLNVIAAGAGQAAAPVVAIGLMHLGGDIGWRLILGVGVLALIPVGLLPSLPESPRWLATRIGQPNRLRQASETMTAMEDRLRRQGQMVPPLADAPQQSAPPAQKVRFTELLKPPYLGRMVVVIVYWVLVYVTTYGFFSYETVLLDKMSGQEPQGLLVTALGDLALPIGAALPLLLVNRINRRNLMGLGSLIYATGLAVLAASTNTTMATAGAFMVALMILVTCGVGYSYTSEIFPTQVRASVMGLADGIGHLGGVIAPYLVVAALTVSGPRGAFGFLAVLMAACAIIIVGLGVHTADRETALEVPGAERPQDSVSPN
jgi:putative MFS transporter